MFERALSLRDAMQMRRVDAIRTSSVLRGSDGTNDLFVKAECSNCHAKFWMKESNHELNCTLCGHHHTDSVGTLLVFLVNRPSSMSPAAAHCFYDYDHQRHLLNRRQSSREG